MAGTYWSCVWQSCGIFFDREKSTAIKLHCIIKLCVKLVYSIVCDLSSICDNLNTLNKVCYGFQHILVTWCIHWSSCLLNIRTIWHIFQYTETILTCYATFIVVICFNLQANGRLFTSDTNWLVPTEHASGSHVVFFRPSKVNSYKTKLHNLNYV